METAEFRNCESQELEIYLPYLGMQAADMLTPLHFTLFCISLPMVRRASGSIALPCATSGFVERLWDPKPGFRIPEFSSLPKVCLI